MAAQPVFDLHTVINDSVGRIGSPVLPLQPEAVGPILSGCFLANVKNRLQQVLTEPEARRNPGLMFVSVHIYLVS